uniref:Uncharacterized protein n=1 Tax=Arundo donax TaxID=35708 RepID=A0A0A8ZW91_ARUDO
MGACRCARLASVHEGQTVGLHFDEPDIFSDEKQQVPKPFALLQAVPIFQ